MKFAQVVALRSWLFDGLGWCLRFSQSLFGAPVAFNSAREAWDGQKGRHAGEWPPEGVQSVIWFDHWGTYGKPARYANWGHVAVALGDGRVLTSPLRNSQLKQWDAGKGEMVGSAIYPSMLAMMRDLGGNPRYLGWSEFINGLRVVKPAPAPPAPSKPNPGQEEDEDMASVYVQDIATKGQGSVFRVLATGRKRLVPTPEWNAIRAQESAAAKAGYPSPVIVGQVSAADLAKIPNA